MTDNTQSLDEILTLAINRGVNESFILDDEQGTQLYKKDCERITFDTKQAILQWVNDEVIGEDTVTKDSNGSLGFTEKDLNQNWNRREQRNILKQHGWKGGK